MTQPSRPSTATPKEVRRGPVTIMLSAAIGLVIATIASWMLGVSIELVGIYFLWPEQGVGHARDVVAEDLEFIAAAPRSLLIADTVVFSKALVVAVERPYRAAGIVAYYEANRAAPIPSAGGSLGALHGGMRLVMREASRWAVLSMYVAQDTLLCLATAAFALPAFVLACLLGAVDGLVRRDLRRWGGGRESSWIYHRAKGAFFWFLTGGFTLYLVWPFGGFNPAYMVLIFTALVAAALSTTLASFKKYV